MRLLVEAGSRAGLRGEHSRPQGRRPRPKVRRPYGRGSPLTPSALAAIGGFAGGRESNGYRVGVDTGPAGPRTRPTSSGPWTPRGLRTAITQALRPLQGRDLSLHAAA